MSQTQISNGESGLVVRNAINNNFIELYGYVNDASGYGFLTTATAAVNTTALQSALDVGGTITVNTPGTYELNDTLKIGSNTKLVCCPGTIFKKTGDYGNVLINKGAETRTWNENIEVRGITIEVNEVDNIVDMDVDGLRGQIGFYYVKHLVFTDFRCEDLGEFQFCIQLVRWENVYFNNITITGDKDGFDIGVGHGGLFENVEFTTHDDAIAIYGSGFPTATIEVGDVYDVTFRNCNDYVKDSVGYTCRIMTGSFADYSNGNTYRTGDLCLNGGNIYINNNANNFSGVAANAPVHSSGTVVGDDGISWKYCNAGAAYTYNVYDITFDGFKYHDARAPIDIRFHDSIYMRSVYPGTETLSSAYNISLINSIIDGPQVVFQWSANLKNIAVNNCIINGVANVIYSDAYNDNSNAQCDIIMFGNRFNDVLTFFMNNKKEGQLMNCVASSNTYSNSTFIIHIQGTTTARLNNTDLPIRHTDLTDFSAEIGDICKTTSGFNVYKAGGWVNLAT